MANGVYIKSTDYEIDKLAKDELMPVINRITTYSLIILLAYLFVFSYALVIDERSCVKSPAPAGVDYSIYYTAGQMVLNGQTENLYNHNIFHSQIDKVLNRETPQILGWPYPPSFLLILVPFSLFSFKTALVLWLLITFALTVLAAYLLLPQYKSITWLACGFPGVLMNLRWGQNAFLNTGLIGLGIYFLNRKPVLSGLMFGLLTYKPQIAFFPLLLLLVTKNWTVFIWSMIFSFTTVLVSAIVFGFSAWLDFLYSLFHSSSTLLTSGWEQLSAVQPTLYSVFHIAGLERQIMIPLLILVSIVVTIISSWVWRNTDRLALKGSVLVLGTLLAIPYYMQYDLMILSIPLILLSHDCLQYGTRPYEILILILLWLMPLVNWPLVFFTKIQICPLIIVTVLLMTILRTKNALLETYPTGH